MKSVKLRVRPTKEDQEYYVVLHKSGVPFVHTYINRREARQYERELGFVCQKIA